MTDVKKIVILVKKGLITLDDVIDEKLREQAKIILENE